MSEFALTGGIGAGKSTVARGLVARGAALIDADEIVRELQEPGGAVYDAIVDRFGSRVVSVDGSLDRQAIADIVFNDSEELDALNALVHPAVGREMAQRRAALVDAGRIVVVDIPLLVKPDGALGRKEYEAFAGIIVVDCDIDVAVARLMEHRGFSESDARARIAAQAGRDQRLAHADHIIDNSGNLEALEPQLDACWSWMTARAAVTGAQ